MFLLNLIKLFFSHSKCRALHFLHFNSLGRFIVSVFFKVDQIVSSHIHSDSSFVSIQQSLLFLFINYFKFSFKGKLFFFIPGILRFQRIQMSISFQSFFKTIWLSSFDIFCFIGLQKLSPEFLLKPSVSSSQNLTSFNVLGV